MRIYASDAGFYLYSFLSFVHLQRLSNGSIDPDSDVNRVIELQDTVEKQNTEMTSARTKIVELTNKCTELDENFTCAQKDLIKCQEQVVKLQRDLREVRTSILICHCFSRGILAVFSQILT